VVVYPVSIGLCVVTLWQGVADGRADPRGTLHDDPGGTGVPGRAPPARSVAFFAALGQPDGTFGPSPLQNGRTAI